MSNSPPKRRFFRIGLEEGGVTDICKDCQEPLVPEELEASGMGDNARLSFIYCPKCQNRYLRLADE